MLRSILILLLLCSSNHLFAEASAQPCKELVDQQLEKHGYGKFDHPAVNKTPVTVKGNDGEKQTFVFGNPTGRYAAVANDEIVFSDVLMGVRTFTQIFFNAKCEIMNAAVLGSTNGPYGSTIAVVSKESCAANPQRFVAGQTSLSQYVGASLCEQYFMTQKPAPWGSPLGPPMPPNPFGGQSQTAFPSSPPLGQRKPPKTIVTDPMTGGGGGAVK